MADLTVGSGGTYSTIAAAVAAAVAGDRVLVLNTHSESLSASTVITASTTTFPVQSPLNILSVNSFSTPVLTAGGGYNWTGNYSLTFNGNYYFCGIGFIHSGTGSVPSLILGTTLSSADIVLDSCNIAIESSNSSARPLRLGIVIGASSNDAYRTRLINCTISVGNIVQGITVGSGNHFIENLTVAGAIAPNSLLLGTASTGLSNLYLSDTDLSSKSIGSLMDGSQLGQTKIFVNRVKVHPTTAATPFGAGAIDPFNELTAVNASNGDTSLAFQYIGGSGTVVTDSTVYATTTPLQDAGTSISRKMTTTATAGRGAPLQTEFLLPVSNDATVTPYIEILVGADGAAALKDNECWIDVSAMTTDGTTQGTTYTTRPGILATGTNLPAGTTSYTGDGFTTERTHRIALTSAITVRQDSFIKITVNLAKPSTVVYVGNYGG